MGIDTYVSPCIYSYASVRMLSFLAFWMSSTTTLLIVNLFTTQEFQASHTIAKDHSRIRKNLA